MVELEVLFPRGRLAVGNGSNQMRSLAPTLALCATRGGRLTRKCIFRLTMAGFIRVSPHIG
jgi:hypothetical protein